MPAGARIVAHTTGEVHVVPAVSKRISRVALVTSLGLAMTAAPGLASGVSLRSPQVVFDAGALQASFDSLGTGVHVRTDQVTGIQFGPLHPTDPCGYYITLMKESIQGPVGIGFYSTSDAVPQLHELFAPGTPVGAWAAATFRADGSATIVVYGPDVSLAPLQTVQLTGLDYAHLGLYMSSPAFTSYTADASNALHHPQALCYFGNGTWFGDEFVSFEAAAYSPATSTFTGALVDIDLFCGDPVHSSTWGSLKARYR